MGERERKEPKTFTKKRRTWGEKKKRGRNKNEGENPRRGIKYSLCKHEDTKGKTEGMKKERQREDVKAGKDTN